MYPIDVVGKAVGLYLDGMTAVEVAEELGVSHGSVSRWVLAYGVKRERVPCTYEALKADPLHPSHGKLSGYEVGCRCAKCFNARKVFDKKRQLRRTLKELES